VAVAVALVHLGRAVRTRRKAALPKLALVGAQPHRAAFFRHAGLIGQQIDHLVTAGRVELTGVRIRPAEDVARELDRRHLHAEAEAEIRHALLARILHGRGLALEAARAEAAL